MLKKKFQLVSGSEGSGELKNKLLNKCWKKSFNLSVVVRVVGNWKINNWINVDKKVSVVRVVGNWKINNWINVDKKVSTCRW